MNNDAFRKLVNSGSVSKTTKEIAREAVEREFQAKRGRKRGRDDDYLSDDDFDNDDNDEYNDKKKGKKASDDKEAKAKEAEAEREEEEKKAKTLKQKYRNRARERREGKLNMDYHDSKDISAVDAEMSKYLGGDEAYTHLVKGLDKALAEKVRREEMGGSGGAGGGPTTSQHTQDIDLDQIMEDATAAKAKAARDSNTSMITSNDCKVMKPSTLSNGMLSYIKNVEERKRKQNSGQLSNISSGTSSSTTTTTTLGNQASLAGRSISRSTLLFSTIANIQDRKCSWELPKETMMSMAQYERLYGNRISTCTPLDRNLILKIKSVFSSLSKSRKSTSNADRKSKTASKTMTDAVNNDLQVATMKPTKAQEPIDDSDDDIFGDIGEYVPPSASNK